MPQQHFRKLVSRNSVKVLAAGKVHNSMWPHLPFTQYYISKQGPNAVPQQHFRKTRAEKLGSPMCTTFNQHFLRKMKSVPCCRFWGSAADFRPPKIFLPNLKNTCGGSRNRLQNKENSVSAPLQLGPRDFSDSGQDSGDSGQDFSDSGQDFGDSGEDFYEHSFAALRGDAPYISACKVHCAWELRPCASTT